jgi:hypothetical protein
MAGAPACPACGGATFTTRRLIADFHVKTCRGCGVRVLIEPTRDAQAAPEFSRINAAEYHRAITAVRRRQAPAMISLVERHRPAGRTWLDVGCSFGVFLAEVERAGFTALGVEPDATAFERARRLLGDDAVRHGSMADDTRPDESVDVVSMLDVLEHIPAAALPAFARLIHRKLRPGGFWLIKVPSTEGLYFQIAHRLPRLARPWAAGVIKRLWQLDYEFPHLVYFNERSLTRYLERHGFETVETTYLEEVPSDTVDDRLRIDGTISPLQARVLAPALHAVNWIEQWRRKSDAMVVLARRAALE